MKCPRCGQLLLWRRSHGEDGLWWDEDYCPSCGHFETHLQPPKEITVKRGEYYDR